MTTGSMEERERIPHDEASGQGQSEGVPNVGRLEGSIDLLFTGRALQVEKRAPPAAGFTQEG